MTKWKNSAMAALLAAVMFLTMGASPLALAAQPLPEPQAQSEEPAAEQDTPDEGEGETPREEQTDPAGTQQPGGEDPDAPAAPDGEEEPRQEPEEEPEPLAAAARRRADIDLAILLSQYGYDTIITGMEITDAGGNPVQEVTVEDTLTFTFSFAIPDEVKADMTGGEYFTFQLPDELKVNSPIEYPLVGNDGETYGYFTVGLDGSVTIVFEDIEALGREVNGEISFTGGIDETAVTNPGEVPIDVPDREDLPPVTVVVKPATASTIDKSVAGFDQQTNPGQIRWNVDINKAMESLTDVAVSEQFPAGTVYNSVQVYYLDVDVNGNVIEPVDTLADPGEYSVGPDGTVTFTDGIDRPYRLVYTTDILDEAKPAAGGNVNFLNGATLTTAEHGDQPATAEVTAGYGKKLSKAADNYDPATQTFTWTIHYNHNETTMPEGSAVVTDTFQNGGMGLVEDSIVLYRVGYDAAGNEVREGELDSSYYTIVPSGTGFEVVFDREIDFAVDIRYETQVEGILDENAAYYNRVVDGEGNTSGQGVTADQQGLVKEMAGYDRDNGIIYWRIYVNRNHYSMHAWQMSDVVTPGQYFAEDLVVYLVDRDDGSRTAVDPANYSESYAYPQFNFAFTQAGDYYDTDESFVFEFSTYYYPQDLGEGDSFTNTATSNWIDDEGKTHSSTDRDTYYPTPIELNNGQKYGTYNAQTKEITWTILIDYNGAGLQNAVLTDSIIGRQSFVPGSAHAYHYSIAANGNVTRGAELSETEYEAFRLIEPTDSDPNYYIELPDVPAGTQGQYWFEYRTSLEGEVIEPTYYNLAHFENELTPDYDLNASVTVANGGTFVGKEGTQDAQGYVWWSITVNPSQSTMHDVVVSDIPSANQLIDMESLVVYGTNVGTNGSISPNMDDVLRQPDDYSASYYQNANGEWQLDVSFVGEINRPYIIRYRVRVVVEPGDTEATLTNNVSITAEHTETITGGGSGNIVIDVATGGGIIVGELGGLLIQKNDLGATGLAGAEFQLHEDVSGAPGEAVGGTLTSGADGSIRVTGLPEGTYWLVETKAPDGYSIPPELLAGIAVQVTVDYTSPANLVTVNDPPGEVEIRKADAQTGDGLEGAVFRLEREGPAEVWTGVAGYEAVETGAGGSYTFYALPQGSYRLVETAAPAGYQPLEAPVPFVVAPDANGVIDIVVAVENLPTRVEVTKRDALTAAVLSGAAFRLERFENGAFSRIREDEDFTSDAQGRLVIEGLPAGRYRLVETMAPAGYTTGEPLEFTLAPDAEGRIPVVTLDFLNPPTQVTLEKRSEDGGLLAGAEFMLELYENGAWVRIREDERLITGEEGTLTLLRLAVGVYRFTELAPPPGYSLDDTPVEFRLEADASGAVAAVFVGPVINLPSVASLQKVDPEGRGLAGAAFVVDAFVDGVWEPVRQGEIYRSDIYGRVSVSALPAGHYRFREVTPPEGYLPTEETVEFTLQADASGEIVPVEAGSLVNRPVPPGAANLVQTGDSARYVGYAIAVAVAILGLGAFVALRRRNKRK